MSVTLKRNPEKIKEYSIKRGKEKCALVANEIF